MKKRKINILFRTYGGKAQKKQTGLGHIVRCINLAKNLRHSANIFFLVEDFGGARKFIKSYGFNNISSLSKEIKINSEIRLLKKLISKNNIDLVIVDKHKIDDKLFLKLKYLVKTLVISDLKKINFSADMIINGYIGLKNQKYISKTNQMYFLGPKYQILNSKFSNQNNTKKKIDLLITIGGLDECNMAEFILESIFSEYENIKVKVILGPIGTKTAIIKKLESKFSKNLTIINSTNNMAKEISQAKFGITSGGLTTYEFVSMNVPFAIICDDLHQIPTAKEWQKLKKAIFLGFYTNTNKLIIKVALQNLLAKNFSFKKSNSKIIDGLGGEKISFEILNMFKNIE